MKATIRDPAILSRLKPVDFAAYLRSSGWRKVADKSNQWTTWIFQDRTGEEYEIVLPFSRDLGDFALRMSDAIHVLEVAEARSQLDILRDLQTVSSDLIRIGLDDGELVDGSVSLEDGARFVQKSKDMMLAAACATVVAQPFFQSNKPPQAKKYIQHARFGQTEQGSFVLTILSPVSMSLAGSNGHQHEVEDPFARRVTRTLCNALAALRDAATEAASTGKVESFVGAVSYGVTANLCDAVVGMATSSDAYRGLNIAFTWSKSRPPSSTGLGPTQILLPADLFPVIREAASHLKEFTTREEVEVGGPVVRLDRPAGVRKGKVTIHDGHRRHVTVELSNSAYVEAVAAHAQGQIVRCSGVLVRDGQTFRLRDPHDFVAGVG